MVKSEKYIQEGCIVEIKNATRIMERQGFKNNSLHEIQKPPKGKLNSLMAVWLKTSKGKLKNIPFPNFKTTGKQVKKRKRRRRK